MALWQEYGCSDIPCPGSKRIKTNNQPSLPKIAMSLIMLSAAVVVSGAARHRRAAGFSSVAAHYELVGPINLTDPLTQRSWEPHPDGDGTNPRMLTTRLVLAGSTITLHVIKADVVRGAHYREVHIGESLSDWHFAHSDNRGVSVPGHSEGKSEGRDRPKRVGSRKRPLDLDCFYHGEVAGQPGSSVVSATTVLRPCRHHPQPQFFCLVVVGALGVCACKDVYSRTQGGPARWPWADSRIL